MKLVDWDGPEGYDLTDVARELGNTRSQEFLAWMNGQTLGVGPQGECVVYKHDYERFLAGLPALD